MLEDFKYFFQTFSYLGHRPTELELFFFFPTLCSFVI